MLKTLFSNPLKDIENLRREKPWIISKEWSDAIAAADGNKGRLQMLYDCLTQAIAEKPQKFDLWWLEVVPSDVESEFAAIGKSDRQTLHKSLLAMTSAEQEKVVKSILKFWYKRSPDQVPDSHKEYAGIKPESVAPVTVEVVPHGAIAEPVAPLPKVEPLPERLDPVTAKVKKILMTSSKVRFIGAEGCGKTSKARWLCKERIALGHQIYWINPHLNAEDKQKLTACGVTIVGGGRDYAAIADFCNKTVNGENSKLSYEYERYGNEVGAKFAPVTFVLDELTNYKDEVGEPIEKFIKASMQEFSKISWHTIYIAHNDTLACMGAPNGISNLIKASVFDLRLETDILKGNRIPKAIAKYRMPNSDDWNDVTIPKEWQ
jgi:hypothetical protein